MKFRGGGVIAPSVKLGKLQGSVRLLPTPEFPAFPDWAFINWRYKAVRDLWDFIGAHPHVALEKGVVKVVGRRREGGEIDLIPAGNSSRKDDLRLERARKRLEKLPSCGQTGHILAVLKGEEIEARYYPHRCHSIFCPYCAYENSKESYARLLPMLESLQVNGRLSFLTLTHKNTVVESEEDVERVINEAFKCAEKLYQFRLFGKRNWAKLKSLSAREALSYYRNAKAKYGREEARRRTRRQIAFLRDFERRYKDYIGSDIKFGQLLNAVVKFELTYNAERGELHPHWHLVVADFHIPKLLMVVIWRLVSGSEIVDIRAVDNTKDATAELTKYITKGWEFPEGDIRVWVEAAMLGRRKFRIWGFEVLELEEEGGEEGDKADEEHVFFWRLRCELKSRKNLHDLPRLVRLMRREEKAMFFDRLIIYDERSGVWEVDLYLRDDGRLIIEDDEFLRALEGYVEEVRALGSLERDPSFL